MECFLPTEIARLVYGYLIDEGCVDAGKLFLETSQHLKECVMFAAKGRQFNTKVFGCNLVEILDLLTEVTCYVKSVECDKAQNVNVEEMLFQLKLILKLISSDECNPHRPVYLKISVPVNHQREKKSKISDYVTHKESSDEISAQPIDESPSSQPHALQILLENKALHEKLAENINKVVATKHEVDSLERILEKKIVETIVDTTEQDPIFQQMLEELVGPVDVANSTPEDTEIESEDVQSACQLNANREPAIPVKSSVEKTTDMNIKSCESDKSCAVQLSDTSVTVADSVATSGILTSIPSSPSILTTSGPSYLGQVPIPEVSAHNAPSILVPCSVLPNTWPSIVVQGTPHVTVAASYNSPVMTSAVNTSLISPSINLQVPRSTIFTPLSQGTSNGRKCVPGSIIRILTTAPQPIPAQVDGTGNSSSAPSQPPVEDNINKLLTSKIMKSNSLPLLLPRPAPPTPIRIGGVRTRGGKRGTFKTYGGKQTAKKVANIAPIVDEGKANIAESGVAVEYPGSESSVSCENTTPISFTVSVIPQESVGAASISSFTTVVTASSTPVVTSTAASTSCTPTLAAEEGDTTNPIIVDATPLQNKEPQVKLHKRLSLSTPRKASHVRALEFKTPPKNIKPRKSMSSPKRKEGDDGRLSDLVKLASDFKLQSIKRSELFKSPPKKEKKAWDADLRVYTVEDDVPTSVGLKRKEDISPQKSSVEDGAKEIEEPPDKMPEKIANSESDEEIMTRIKKDVLDVISEEDLTNISCNSSFIKSKISKSPSHSPLGSTEIGDIGVSSSVIKKLYAKSPSNRDDNSLDTPISTSPKDKKNNTTEMCSFNMTPPQPKMSPTLSTPPTPSSAIIVETLINECKRIEKAEAERREESVASESMKSSNLEIKKPPDISPKALQAVPGIVSLKTPAKSTFSLPVEMTPLSKIINEETQVNKCVLLTPTIPPTPDIQQIKGMQNAGHSVENECTPAKITEPHAVTLNSEPSPTMKSIKPSKTPQVRLKAKVKHETSKTKAKGKKNPTAEEINCSKLIEECLQKVKESLYSRSSSDSEKDDKYSSLKGKNKKRHDNSNRKNSTQKKEAVNKRKYESTRKNSDPLPRPESAAVVSEDTQSPILKEDRGINAGSVQKTIALNTKQNAPKASKGTPHSILRSQLTSSGPSGNRTPKKVDHKKEPIGSNVPKENASNLPKRPDDHRTVDLDNYAFTFTIDSGEGKMISHLLRPSSFLNLFEFPARGDSVATSVELNAVSYEPQNLVDEGETTRKRKPSSSLSSDGSGSRKRSRSSREDNEHQRHSHHTSRDRSRRRSPHPNADSRYQTAIRDSPHFRGHCRPKRRGRFERVSFHKTPHGRSRLRQFDRYPPDRSPPRSRSRTPKTNRLSSSSRHESPTDSPDIRRQSSSKSPHSRSRTPKSNRLSSSSRHESPADSPDIRRQSSSKSPHSRSMLKDKYVTSMADTSKEARNQRSCHPSDLEDGELGDSSPSFSPLKGGSSSHETSQQRSNSPVKDESKQALLQQVGLDHFLSIVHGSDDRSSPAT